MHIYHYSKQKHDILKSLNCQNKIKSKSQLTDYNNHISFFIDPVNVAGISQSYGPQHKIWYKGNTIYEHKVSIMSLPLDVYYVLVESLEKYKALKKYEKRNKDAGSSNWLEGWKQVEKEVLEENKLSGYGVFNLEKLVVDRAGRTDFYFKKASKSKDFLEYKHFYAANVPHLMLYYFNFNVEVKSIRKLVVS